MILETQAPPGLEPAIDAPPFRHNPSSMSRRRRIAALGLVAAAIAFYMGACQWGLITSVWDPVFGSGSDTVLTSSASHFMARVFGVPAAAFGGFAYLTEVMLAFAGSTRRWQCRPWLVVLFGIDLIPLGITSVVLVILQGASVGAWCFPCLVIASISLLLVFLAYDEVRSSLRFLREVRRNEPSRTAVWNTFCGRPTPVAIEIAHRIQG